MLKGIPLNLHDCPRCNGRGEVPVYGRVGQGILYYNRCPECNGTARKSAALTNSMERAEEHDPTKKKVDNA